ncbi:MAG: efflux RND transporter periplasmic adaptor subunit [Pseudomonadales bacterium]|nr:efflux RND transporter periplasmic adaptor subunit [Pseudomonadales bacterium]
MRNFLLLLVVVAFLGGVAYLLTSERGGGGMRHDGPPDVTTVPVTTTDVRIFEELPGRTSAIRIAEVRPQVGGIIKKRLFEEGSTVTEGQHLYQLDDAAYKVAMQRATASREQALASQHAASLRVDRYKELLGTKAISQQDYDDAQIALEQANAAVRVAEAAIKSARLDLEYTRVYAPISGRIGRSMVTEGALVTANQSEPLSVITELDPIYVDINQSTTESVGLRKLIADGRQVEVELVSDASGGTKGVLQFSDVLVDESTGTVQLRALFPNPDMTLLPGMFVRAQLDLGFKRGMLIPQQAVVRDENGTPRVWRLGKDNVVESVAVTTDRAIQDKWLVTGGLEDGDMIVTEGLQRLSPGIEVIAHNGGS